MTYAEFTALIATHLDVDANRRGAAASLRESMTKAAMADLKHHVDCYKDGKTSYGENDLVPFDAGAAEAVAYFVKSRLARAVDKDLGLAATFMSDYVGVRRRLYRECQERQQRDGLPQFTKTVRHGDAASIAVAVLEAEGDVSLVLLCGDGTDGFAKEGVLEGGIFIATLTSAETAQFAADRWFKALVRAVHEGETKTLATGKLQFSTQ